MGSETTKTADTKAAAAPLDEYAKGIFAALGYPEDLPEGLLRLYHSFKRTRDRISPGRLSSEGFATVILLYEMTFGSLLKE